MVNQKTALEKIIDLINVENLNAMKKWSDRFRITGSNRPSWYILKLKTNVRNILNLISGNDIIEMLQDVLSEKEKRKLQNPKHENALKELAQYYKKSDLKKRHFFIRPLRNTTINFTEMRRLGFRVSKHLWNTCFNSNKRNNGGGKSIPRDLQDSIQSFLKEKSNIASNRLIKNKNKNDPNFGNYENARYLEENVSELYKKFPFSSELAKSTFFKYSNLTGEFKKPFRWTDLCDYCEKGVLIKEKIKKSIIEMDGNIESIDNTKGLILDFEKKGKEIKEALVLLRSGLEKTEYQIKLEKIKELISNLKDFETVNFHKNIARAQRIAYKNHYSNVDELRNKVMIEVDFKQKIVFGMSPRQINSEFYSQISRSCLGFGIFFVNQEEKIEEINFDIISSDLTEDARAVVRGFRLLRSQEFFKRIEKNSLIVWMDCGKHFRNSEVIGYLLKDLAREKIHVNLNFFCEKHGKNLRDAHFSCIARFIKYASLKKKLCSSKDIVEAINDGQKLANENSLKSIQTIAFELDFETDIFHSNNFPTNRTITIQNVESFYNYRTVGDEFRLVTSVLSDEEHFIELRLKGYTHNDISHESYEVLEEEKIVEIDFNLINLRLKQFRVNCALNKIRDNLISHNVDTNNRLLNFFSLSREIELQEREYTIEKPKYCNGKKTPKKNPCFDCKEICSLSMEMLLSENAKVSQSDIYEELMIHHHPSSRIIKENNFTRARTTDEAAEELASHYEFAHNKKRPIIL